MNLATAYKVFTASVSSGLLLIAASTPARAQLITNPKMATLHATVTVTGGVNFTGAYDTRIMVPTCADVARGGTRPPGNYGGPVFEVPVPMPPRGSPYGPVGGGHTFSTDVAAFPYHGPGSYTAKNLTATQMDADTPLETQETHIFAFPDNIGTLTVNADASGSFQFNGLQDPGSVKISGQVTWTCSS
jgi:hypothetical protein